MSDEKSGFFRTILTEDPANKVWDIIRIVGAMATLNFLAMADYSVIVKGNPFDAMSYGTGFGALIGGIGAALFAYGKAPP